jgi:hypothetical protein
MADDGRDGKAGPALLGDPADGPGHGAAPTAPEKTARRPRVPVRVLGRPVLIDLAGAESLFGEGADAVIAALGGLGRRWHHAAVAVDLTGVLAVSEEVLDALARLGRRVRRRRGWLCLHGVGPGVKATLRGIGLDRELNVCDSRNEALGRSSR